ncbi:unnamed protein product, partial [Prorocentrum cordatum]
DVGLLLEGALVALRHAAATGAAAEEQLAEVADLDQQLSSLLSVHAKEPLFFWHGPKWALLSRVWHLFDGAGAGAGLRGQLEGLASAQPLDSAGENSALVSELAGPVGAAGAGTPPRGVLPLVGVIADDAGCGRPRPCTLTSEHLKAAAAYDADAGAAHVLVLASKNMALRRVGALIGADSSYKVSLQIPVPEAKGDAGKQLEVALVEALTALGRKEVDLLWLPYKMFTKQVWTSVSSFLSKAIEQGTVRGYGVHAEARTKVLARKLLDRRPAPAAWLAPHSLPRPLEPEAVDVARELGVQVVAMPRLPGTPGAGARAYLEVLAGTDAAKQEATQHLWTLQRASAIAVKLHPAAPEQQLDALRLLPTTRLDAAGVRLLDALHGFSRPEQPKPDGAPGAERKGGEEAPLERAAARARAEARRAVAASPRRGMPASGGPSTGGVTPSVSAATLKGMPGQQRTYKENNHVIYREDFFDAETFAAMKAEVQRLWRSRDLEPNCNLDGRNRLGGYVLDINPQDTSLYRLIYGNEAFRRWVTDVNNEDPDWRHVAVGLPHRGPRVWAGEQRHGMPPGPPDVRGRQERFGGFAFTIENDSKCNVTYWDASNKLHEVQTRANSLMMVRANAARHCVSPTVEGTRTIVKFIFVGDYRKSKEFWHYTDNRCTEDNPNVAAVRARRESAGHPEL